MSGNEETPPQQLPVTGNIQQWRDNNELFDSSDASTLKSVKKLGRKSNHEKLMEESRKQSPLTTFFHGKRKNEEQLTPVDSKQSKMQIEDVNFDSSLPAVERILKQLEKMNSDNMTEFKKVREEVEHSKSATLLEIQKLRTKLDECEAD